jgi:hypothetical protein
MTFAHPEITGRDAAPLLVRPRGAWRLLGCGNTRGYRLIAAGELESFLDGRARWITTDSIRGYIARKLAAARGDTNPPRRGPGRPRKIIPTQHEVTPEAAG